MSLGALEERCVLLSHGHKATSTLLTFIPKALLHLQQGALG